VGICVISLGQIGAGPMERAGSRSKWAPTWPGYRSLVLHESEAITIILR
jgi:hypothetical protein